MAMTVNIAAFKDDLSKLLALVREGQEVTIMERNKPFAKVVPLQSPVVRLDLSGWFKKHPPLEPTARKQTPAADLIRELRDEE